MSENKVSKRIISNVFWALAGKFTGLASALLVGIFVARYLGPTQYGIMNYAVSFVTLFLVIATFGFENIEIRNFKSSNVRKFMYTSSTINASIVVKELYIYDNEIIYDINSMAHLFSFIPKEYLLPLFFQNLFPTQNYNRQPLWKLCK